MPPKPSQLALRGFEHGRYGARVLRPTRDEAKTVRETQAELCLAVAGVHWRDESERLVTATNLGARARFVCTTERESMHHGLRHRRRRARLLTTNGSTAHGG